MAQVFQLTNRIESAQTPGRQGYPGKTIETGIIHRELQSRGEATRTLIICPAGLTINWQSELTGTESTS